MIKNCCSVRLYKSA